MNKGQKILTGIALAFVIFIGLNCVDSDGKGPAIAFGVLAVVYTGAMFMLKKPAPPGPPPPAPKP
jgi:hypothetical protein